MVAQAERDLVKERTHAGLAATRVRGRKGGRPKKLADPKKLALARALHDGRQADVATICATLGVSRATPYRALGERSRVAPATREDGSG
jgi:DNA invertase Pin-like site-specific DNA recombinase